MTYTVSRRKFLSFSAAVLASILSSADHAPRIISSNRLENRLVKIFSMDFQAARAVGHAYLRETPHEYNADILTEMILQRGISAMIPLDVLSEKDLMAKLRDLITEDFTSENIVRVDGWVLSKTEAQLCALCTMV